MRLLLILAACAATLALPAGASAATCTPTTQTYPDAPADGDYLQPPEITGLTAEVRDNCAIVLTTQIANRPYLFPDDQLQWYLDADNNPATGLTAGPTAGADDVIVLLSDGTAVAVDAVSGAPIALLSAVGRFGVVFPIDLIGATNNSTIRIVAVSLADHPNAVLLFVDFAPDPGNPPYLLQLQPAAAPPGPPPTPAPAPAPAPAVQCVVPALRGLTLARARTKLAAAHCALGAVHRRRGRGTPGRVLGSSPRTGTTAPAGTPVSVTVRARPR